MNKTQLWNEVEAILGKYKRLPKDLVNELETLLKPKSGGGISKNPPKEIDGIIHYWCRYHQTYEPEQNMVISNAKSKGYCKAAAAKSNKLRKMATDLMNKSMELLAKGEVEEAKKIAQEAQELKQKATDPQFFDLEKDWEEFNGNK